MKRSFRFVILHVGNKHPPIPLWIDIKSSLIFRYSRCITSKNVTSLRCPSTRQCAQATQLLSKKMLQRWRAVGNTVSDLTVRDLNLRPPAPQTNALLLDQLTGRCESISIILKTLHVRLTCKLVGCLKNRASGFTETKNSGSIPRCVTIKV